MRRRLRNARERKGTTAVEAAFVLPVFLFFLFALIEFGHAQMVNNVLRSSTRAAARLGSTDGRTTAEVEAHVRQVLGAAVDVNAVAVFVKNGQSLDDGGAVPETGEGFESMPDIELNDAEPRQLYLVRARVNYNDIALLPMPFMEGVVLAGQAFMRHE
ncbi:MAG: TadE/TadG family type IV pilus assembly protein [Planctomycetota bacterium]